MLYNVFFYLMLFGFGGLTILSSGKQFTISILLCIVNYLIFKK